MYPVIFKLGPFVVYTYGLALTVAVIIATFLIWRRARKLGYNEENLIDMTLFSLFTALVFSRLVYVASHFGDFGWEFLKIVLITYFPGLDGAAAFAGGLLGFLLYATYKRWNKVRIFDCIVKGLSLAIFVVMIGAFFSGSYIGTPSQQPWAVVLPGYSEPRHPIALYYAIVSLFTYILLVVLDRTQKPDGILSSAFFILFGIAFIVFEWYTEGGAKIMSIQLTQFIGLASILLGSYLLYNTLQKVKKSTTLYSRDGGHS
jgi:phosphatidylglycerol---prolipoprotein diacylglyceryl transferase